MKSSKQSFCLPKLAIAIAVVAIELLITAPAFAHHPLDGRLPANFFDGLMSGFGHPVIGLDHLAFVIASGLMAMKITGGIIIPFAFTVATGIGAAIHLASISLPVPETIIAATVVIAGFLLAIARRQQKSNYSLKIAVFAALAGIFHGFAYGEGIFGAEPTAMIAYLIGFITIQLAIALVTYFIANKAIKMIRVEYLTRFVGGAIASMGIIFLSSAIIG